MKFDNGRGVSDLAMSRGRASLLVRRISLLERGLQNLQLAPFIQAQYDATAEEFRAATWALHRRRASDPEDIEPLEGWEDARINASTRRSLPEMCLPNPPSNDHARQSYASGQLPPEEADRDDISTPSESGENVAIAR